MKKTDRDALIETFLPAGAVRHPLAGDASFRTYERISIDGKTRVLMNAPPDKEDTRPFVAVAKYLSACGFSAPEIIKEDFENGLLLLEDFGDNSYNAALAEGPALEEVLYRAAIDVLVALHKETPPKTLPLPTDLSYDLPAYDQTLLFKELNLFPEWYLPELFGKENEDWKRMLETIWRPLFEKVTPGNTCLTLRDYHADNLMWLPERSGVKRVGLLDFQDAVRGHPAYDLVSLLQDARRPYDAALEARMIDRYLEASDREREDFMAAYQILGAQRNTKIIGIFTRLHRRDGKAQYPKMIPHVWSLLEENLKSPVLKDAKAWFDAVVPKARRS